MRSYWIRLGSKPLYYWRLHKNKDIWTWSTRKNSTYSPQGSKRVRYDWVTNTFTFNKGRSSQDILVVKNPPANTGDERDSVSIPGLGRSPGVGNGNTLQDSCLENPMDKGAKWATVHAVAKSQTWLSASHQSMKAEAEEMSQQIRGVPGLPATIEIGERYGTNSPSEPPGGINEGRHLSFRLLVSRILRE